ncbi:MAG: 1-acyl-sn-glycerol-3-phosphate acyltransferase [Anaerolineae bacterium]|nr:1-acyl-sn-glycerol-3-phosphate acyltransferase [Anaerolineae bacterium]MDW8171843.1 1-acyl-sn-glycerol-3-phosphate acyltransferase [Anaerolineae bacterium]
MWLSLQRGALEVVRFFVVGLWHLGGWRLIQGLPELDKYVAVAVPHTANIDYYHMLSVMIGARRFPHVTVKDSWIKTPIIGPMMKALGGIPIDRSASHNVSDQLAARLRAAERMVLVFTPEGTRKRTEYWRTGFYYTAYKAGVPIVCVYVDYPRKVVSAELILEPTGDLEADFEIIKAYYEANGVGKRPENKSVLALKPRGHQAEVDEAAEAQ